MERKYADRWTRMSVRELDQLHKDTGMQPCDSVVMEAIPGVFNQSRKGSVKKEVTEDSKQVIGIEVKEARQSIKSEVLIEVTQLIEDKFREQVNNKASEPGRPSTSTEFLAGSKTIKCKHSATEALGYNQSPTTSPKASQAAQSNTSSNQTALNNQRASTENKSDSYTLPSSLPKPTTTKPIKTDCSDPRSQCLDGRSTKKGHKKSRTTMKSTSVRRSLSHANRNTVTKEITAPITTKPAKETDLSWAFEG
ncbi:hypothetical protein CC80DRAFT_549217 [Byssothecium circinans]|uniref:Uncharacterized protein n=1 Tax=Byssothecium circinans TaxID=147558 RepID=A0A6A5TUU7_9PLEO|nr:hypothetical protein CC80DRAFT_549217 [Byssothecium circinans]